MLIDYSFTMQWSCLKINWAKKQTNQQTDMRKVTLPINSQVSFIKYSFLRKKFLQEIESSFNWTFSISCCRAMVGLTKKSKKKDSSGDSNNVRENDINHT